MLIGLACVRVFESSVNSDGTQTLISNWWDTLMFESSVNSDGTQTYLTDVHMWEKFESSVNSDGTQTKCLCNGDED